MTEEVFKNLYWKQYIMIEKEFKASVKYVAIDKSNFNAFSDVYAKLLLQIGSEVDVVAKMLCQAINNSSKAEKINQYQTEINSHFSDFEMVKVACGDIEIEPWKGWSTSSPDWWKIYNGVKHQRNEIETYGLKTQENYKFANQETVLTSLAGLYQLEQYLYTFINHNKTEETPLPGSRLFKLVNQGWENKHFGQDSLLYVKDGCLWTLFSENQYSDW